jgi:hypothetical protein
MKKLLPIVFCTLLSIAANAQLNGTFTIGSAPYTSLSAAIAALNAYGTSTGVTFLVPANYTETFIQETEGHITATGSAAAPIVFMKTGSGSNPVITAGIGDDSNYDGIIVLEGCDYITFDGINLVENPLNTTDEQKMEYGYGLLKSSNLLSGCQHVTIRNCTVSLDRTYVSSTGIYGGNHNLVGSSDIVYNENQLSAYNHFHSLTITDCYDGIKFLGSNNYGYGPEIYDKGYEIGVSGPITITNLGEGALSVRGINVNYHDSLTIANTTINAGVGNGSLNYAIETTSGGAISIYNNTISLNNVLYGKTFYGIYNTMGTLLDNRSVNISNNTIQDIVFAPAAIVSIIGIYNGAEADSVRIFNNTIRNISKTTNGTIYGIYNSLASTTGTEYISGNMIYNLSVSAGSVYGIYSTHTLFGNGNRQIINNQIHDITAGSTIYGVYCYVGGNATIEKNKIFNFTGTSSNQNIRGIDCSSVTKVVRISNNMVYGLNAPVSGIASGVYGADISGSDSLLFYYNTIVLDGTSSTALNFGNACAFVGSNDFIELRNNNLVNLSVPVGTGIVYALWTNESLAGSVYSPFSGHNNFYAGTPSPTHIVVSSLDGFLQTIDEVQNIAAPAEAGSISENPPFVNISVNPYDVHLQPSTPTMLESGGQRMVSPSVPDDIDADKRWGETGYSGSGTSTDIGADEGNFTGFNLRPPNNFMANNVNSVENKITFTPTGSPVNNVVVVYNLTGTFTTPSGTPPSPGNAFAGGTLLYNGTSSAPLLHSGLVFGTKYYYAAWSKDASNNFSVRTSSSATASVDAPKSIIATAAGSRQMNLNWTKNTENHNVLVVFSTGGITGTPANGTAYTSGDIWATGGTVIYSGAAGNFAQSGLSPFTTYQYKIWSYDNLNYYSNTGLTASQVTFREVPYNQMFTATSGLPSGWTKSGNYRQYNNHGIHNGIGISDNLSSGETSSVMAPIVHLTANPCRLLFDYRNVDANEFPDVFADFISGDSLNIELSNNGGLSYLLLHSINSSNHFNTIEFKGKIIDLTAWSNQNVIIRFRVVSATPGHFVDLDSFILEEIPVCAYPALPLTTEFSYNSATLNWEGSGNNWQVEYGTVGFVLGTGTTLSGLTTNSVTLNGLSGSTTYDVYVRRDCGSGIFSNWSEYATFTTLCDPVTAPIEEHFTNSTVPACWQLSGPEKWYFNPDYYFNNNAVTDHTTGGGTNMATVFGSSNDSSYTDISLLSPFIDVAALTNVQLRFFIYNNEHISTTSNQTIHVDYWDGSAWHNSVFNRTIQNRAGGWEEVFVYLNEYPVSGPVRFRFVVDRNGGNSFEDIVIIDDVYVEEGPVCPPPQNIEFSNITSNSATANWSQSGSSSLWDFEYGIAPLTIGSGILSSGLTAKPIELSGLTENSTYQVNIRTNCGTTYSNWVTSASFPTPCNPVTTLWAEGFEQAEFPPACWDTIHFNPQNHWSLSTEAGGYGTSSSSLMIDFFSYYENSSIETLPFDISTLGTVQFKFDYAYATYLFNELDQLQIFYSTDFGSTYNVLNIMPGGNTGILNTGGAVDGFFVPTASQWATQALTLPVGTNRIKFHGISAFGNQLYIDNVRVEGTTSGSNSLSLKLFIEGLYAGASTMNKAMGTSGDQYPGTIADKFSVELRDQSDYASILFSANNISLYTDGTATILVPDVLTGSYYISIRHRNSIETVSSEPVSFAGTATWYDFSVAQSKAFSNNLKHLGDGVYGLYSGDINADAIIDALDLIDIDNEASYFSTGYLATDLNGDGIVDGPDISICGENASSFISRKTP